ncbi:hypothetical protein [Occallatibacter savannae]|uniref:hypothetical protein n=1 Tax=Occallatibacter savannae TaxID=1002691 RepID=UPI000D692EF9|nr:hypothetical protein [Occallatibacter savannae]
MKTRLLQSFVCLAALLGALPHCAASDYAQRKAAASLHCESINPSEYETGLAFNPDGYRSFYVQSECFQNAAIQFRDASMCDRVRRRFSLLSSSWGVSTAQCRKLVAQGIATDRAEIEAERRSYLPGPPRLLSFRIERNGNGRDFDILPEFAPGYSHGYTLSFEIIGARKDPILLHSDGYYLDQNPILRIFVRQSEIRARFPELQLNHPYQVRATVTLSIGNGGMSGYWSDEFLEKEFPARARSQTLIKEITF